jgi:hypothetical protein
MTRTHVIRELLNHGNLTWGELMEITGWTYNQLRGAMARLLDYGDVVKEPIAPRRNIYRLAK